jgi:hypothetical protein
MYFGRTSVPIGLRYVNRIATVPLTVTVEDRGGYSGNDQVEIGLFNMGLFNM